MDAPTWKRNEIIRSKENGHPFLVLHVHKRICTIVVDLEDPHKLPTAFVVLPRDYDSYALDEDMDDNRKGWTFRPTLLT